MKKKLKLSLVALLWPIISLFAQMQMPPEGLQVGDKLPKEIWNAPLKVVNHPGGKETITLGDYKGKLIILDFWATTCSGCIAKMPVLDSLQNRFKGRAVILPISYENNNRVAKFMRANVNLKGLELPSVTEDSLLKASFPHSLLPHVAWIGENGKLVATTEAWHVTAAAIEKALNGKGTELPLKRDLLSYDKERPLLVNGNGGDGETIVYRSLLTGYLDGVPTSYGISQLGNGAIRARSVNNTIVELYKLAYPHFGKWYQKSRIRLGEGNRLRYHFNPYFQAFTPRERESRKRYLHCYELIVPARDSGKLREYIRQDLDRYFGISARVETRKTKCFVLVRAHDGAKVGKGPAKGESKISLTGTSTLRGENMSTLVWCLENIPGTLPVVDETGWEGPISMDIELTDNLALLREQLRTYGLDIKKAVREVEVFVVSKTEKRPL